MLIASACFYSIYLDIAILHCSVCPCFSLASRPAHYQFQPKQFRLPIYYQYIFHRDIGKPCLHGLNLISDAHRLLISQRFSNYSVGFQKLYAAQFHHDWLNDGALHAQVSKYTELYVLDPANLYDTMCLSPRPRPLRASWS